MDFKFFILSIIVILLSFSALLYYMIVIVEKRNRLKELEIKNNQYLLFMQMDPKLIENEIDELIKKYLNDYYLNNIFSSNIDFIRREQIDIMVKQLVKNIIEDISELYLFYIKCLTNIRNDDDLLKYIYKKVKEHVLDFVTEYNKPME